VKHYQDYIARLNAVPTMMEQVIDVLRQGEKDKLMPPRYLLEKVIVQCRSIAAPAGAKNAFAQPLAKFPATISAADQRQLQRAMVAAIDHKVRPAYVKLASFIETEYAPAGRTEAGIWSLPNGDARYCRMPRQHGTHRASFRGEPCPLPRANPDSRTGAKCPSAAAISSHLRSPR
jgi:uncharacterized protein (DUF885 family)